MKPHQRAVLGALGVRFHPSHEQTQTPTETPRDRLGRFASTEPPAPHVTLDGGPQLPPPPVRRTADEALADHSRLIAALAQAPRVIPNLERA